MRRQRNCTNRKEMVSICFLQKYGSATTRTVERSGSIGYSSQVVRPRPERAMATLTGTPESRIVAESVARK